MDAALSSTAANRPASKLDFWSQVAHYGNETSGFLGKAEAAIAGGLNIVGPMGKAAEGIGSSFARMGVMLGLLGVFPVEIPAARREGCVSNHPKKSAG